MTELAQKCQVKHCYFKLATLYSNKHCLFVLKQSLLAGGNLYFIVDQQYFAKPGGVAKRFYIFRSLNCRSDVKRHLFRRHVLEVEAGWQLRGHGLKRYQDRSFWLINIRLFISKMVQLFRMIGECEIRQLWKVLPRFF